MLLLQKMTTSKKIALFSCVCFAVVLAFVMLSMALCFICGREFYDVVVLTTMVTVSGASFGTSAAFYYNKSRAENIIKLKIAFLQEKYKMLNELGVVDKDYAIQEINTDINNIESDFDTEIIQAQQEITHNNL